MPRYRLRHNFPRLNLDLIGNFVSDMGSDLKIVYIFLIVAAAFIFVPVLNHTIIRPVAAFALLLFMPGYTLMAAVYPGKADIGGIQRFVFSFVSSISAVPFIGLILNYTEWGVRLEPMAVSVIAFTALCALIANKRRLDLSAEERFSTNFSAMLSEARSYLFPPSESSMGRFLTAILFMAVATLIVTTAYFAFLPKSEEKFTEFYILGDNGTTSGYPSDFYLGYPQPLTIGIANHEHRNVSYSVGIYLDDGVNRSLLHTENIGLTQGEKWEKGIDLMPNDTGTGMKLEFDLFMDGNMTSPYRETHLWVNVSEPGEKNTTFIVRGFNNSSAEGYSRYWLAGTGKRFEVTVTNHEYRKVPYLLEVTVGNDTSRTGLYSSGWTLEHNESWTPYVLMRPNITGENMILRFSLYADGNMASPYKEFSTPTRIVLPEAGA